MSCRSRESVLSATVLGTSLPLGCAPPACGEIINAFDSPPGVPFSSDAVGGAGDCALR